MSEIQPRGIPLYYLALACMLLPIVTIHATYLIAASNGHVPWCVPYWDSCTSISATGRELPEKLWFKTGMIPAALFTMGFWWWAAQWRLQSAPTRHSRSLKAIPWLGCLAAVALILYTAALGEAGETYQHVRRTGIILCFALTFMAQLLFSRLIGELATVRKDSWLQKWQKALFILNMVLLGTGILSIILDAVMGPAYDEIEDAFEWVLALLLNLYFAGPAVIWARENVRIMLTSP